MSLGDIPVLCVIQARWRSTRLPGKMLLDFGGETLIARAWRIANECSQELHDWVPVVAIPKADEVGPLGDELRRIGARIFAWNGPEWDVLGRFYHCAHTYRWHPDSVIVRYTPDDPFKTPGALRAAARGFRLPVEQGGEAFTLAQLDEAQIREGHEGESAGPCHPNAWHDGGKWERAINGIEKTCPCGRPIKPIKDYREMPPARYAIHCDNPRREHITDALFPFPLPPLAGEGWTIDDEPSYQAALKRLHEDIAWSAVQAIKDGEL